MPESRWLETNVEEIERLAEVIPLLNAKDSIYVGMHLRVWVVGIEVPLLSAISIS